MFVYVTDCWKRMRNPWSVYLWPRPPPPVIPGRGQGQAWCPVPPPTATTVTSSPQRNPKTVCNMYTGTDIDNVISVT